MKGIGYATAVLGFCLLPMASLKAQVQNNADIDYISPVPGSSLNMPQVTIAIRTKEEIDPASLASSGILSVTAASSGDHAGRLVLSDDARTILFVPNVPFTEGEEVTVSLGDGLRVIGGKRCYAAEIQFYDNTKIAQDTSASDKFRRIDSILAPSFSDVFRFRRKRFDSAGEFPTIEYHDRQHNCARVPFSCQFRMDLRTCFDAVPYDS